ncbi:ATP-dependent DNA helicase DDX11 [Schistosoma japonicum]|nr:ATP-dependent DNA helicase DDX11 [Schistosoma japonicum]
MDDFYNDSVGDQFLMELNIPNLTPPTLIDKKQIPSSKHESNSISSSTIIQSPAKFIDFPYPKPYSQQLTLMQTVYKTLESNCCGIFESPTGTGKSLSLLTATLRWLLDYNEKQMDLLHNLQSKLKLMNNNNNDEDKENNSKEYDWIIEYDKNRLLKQQIQPQIEDLLIYKSTLQLIEEIKLSTSSSSLTLPTTQHTDSFNVPDELTTVAENNSQIDIQQLKNFIEISNDDDFSCNADELFLCKPDEDLSRKHDTIDIDDIELDQHFESQQQQLDNGLLHIIYCSRTHSQLEQIAKEFSKCKTLYDKVTVIQLSSRNLLCTNEAVYQLKHPDLINIACLELNRPRNSREQGQLKQFKCPMRNSTAVNNLSRHLLIGHSALNIANIIRDNIHLTKSSHKSINIRNDSLKGGKVDDARLPHIACPYYANRKGIPLAQLILVPYSSLLQPSNRLTSGLVLKNSIVIIDEAHNLLEATASSMSVSLSLIKDLDGLEKLFASYLQYYRSRLSSFLALRLRQMKHFIQQLKVYLNSTLKHIHLSLSSVSITAPVVIIKTVNKLISESNLDNLNLSEFISCLEYQHFIMKLIGFSKWSFYIQQSPNSSTNAATVTKTTSQMTNLLASMKRKYVGEDNKTEEVNQVGISNKRSKMDVEKSDGIGSSLFKFHSFLLALESCEEDARIVIEPSKTSVSQSDISSSSNTFADDLQDLCLRVIFLNPGRYLKNLIQEAKSVLLVGGTMQPFNEAIEQIFLPSGKLPGQIVTFSCDHVIDARKQLAVYPLGVHSYQSNDNVLSLDFTYQNRTNPHIIDACGEIILQICQQLPAGIVVFTPSYEYQSILHNRWETTGLLNKISKYKSVFHEPKTSANLDQIMQAYGVAAKQKLQHKHGAVLLCVIGGKLSEGINFTDDLARVVIIIGMPYANPQSPILREKMAYLDSHFSRQSHSMQNPGRQYYETMCMRSINQAIGRSVRHAKDYAVVFLLDSRYYRSTIQSQLPKWVQQSIIVQQSGESLPSNQRKFLNLSEALEHAKRFFSCNQEYFK